MDNNANNFGLDILKILADMPQSIRLSMLRQKIQEFLQFDNDLIFQTITSALSSMKDLNRPKAIILISSWLNELLSFSDNEIQKIIDHYIKVIKHNPSLIRDIEPEILVESFNNLEGQKKDKLYIVVYENLFLIPDKEEFISLMPKELLKLMHSNRS